LESLTDQRPRGYVIAARSGKYVIEQLYTVVSGNALHEYFYACILAHELTIDQ